MPTVGRIEATVFAGLAHSADRERPLHEQAQCSHKVRLVIWSGPDFRSPTINRGVVVPDAVSAAKLAEAVRLSLDLLGIPEGDPARVPLRPPLLPEVEEGVEYRWLSADAVRRELAMRATA